MPDNGPVTEQTEIPIKPKRGRETATDMIRSMGLVLLIVGMVWFFARPPSSDEQTIRQVDPASDVAGFSAQVPTAPVPGPLPDRWRATSSTFAVGTEQLRIGYVTPTDRYAEYAASTGIPVEFRDALTGQGVLVQPVDVDGASWDLYASQPDASGDAGAGSGKAGALSLVRSYGPVTVVLGSLRSTATLDELVVLARSLALR